METKSTQTFYLSSSNTTTMKQSYFSIIFAVINPVTTERVSLGLIFKQANNQVYFKWSKQKLSFLGKVIPHEKQKLISSLLHQIDQTVSIKNKDLAAMFPGKLDSLFSQEYLSFLSAYNHNTLQFSSPGIIEVEYSKKLFEALFDKYIFHGSIEKSIPKVKQFDNAKKILYPKIKSKVNIDFKITTDHLPKLIVPVEVDFIGKNGRPVSGNFIDFDKRIDLVRNEISDYVSLIKSFELMNQEGKYFTIANEPSKAQSKNHNLWGHLRDLKITDFVASDETDIISEYINDNDVIPYFETGE